MKISLALGPRRPLSRQTAWGCLTTNLALPGAGSLVAGRVSGYPQLALGVGGMPRGRIIEVYGPESSGKTTVALQAVAQAQKLGGEGN